MNANVNNEELKLDEQVTETQVDAEDDDFLAGAAPACNLGGDCESCQ